MSRLVEIKSQKSKLYQLFETIQLSDFENTEVIDIFALILSLYNSNPRLSYFTISEYVIKAHLNDDSVTSILPMQFNIFIDKVTTSNEIKKSYSQTDIDYVIKLTLKILDHIELERIRLDNLHSNGETLFKVFFNKANKELRMSFNEVNNRIDRIDTGAVTILGIFSAVIVSVFGTLNIFSSVIISANSLSIPRLLFILSFSGLVIFDIIFLLLFTISKFTNTNLENFPTRRRNSFFHNSTENLKPTTFRGNLISDFKGFYRKYPYVFYFNILMLSLIIISVVIWYFNKYQFNFL